MQLFVRGQGTVVVHTAQHNTVGDLRALYAQRAYGVTDVDTLVGVSTHFVTAVLPACQHMPWCRLPAAI